ncbi:MAG TPA: AMP-binding protein [Thermoanaerobaculia bacterium]
MIDLTSSRSHLLINPRLPEEDRRALQAIYDAAPPLPAHVWIATSGSTGGWKLVALSKKALLISAAAVNRRLDVRGGETWCCVLPPFHVGGLGIFARASISGGHVLEMPWNPHAFASAEFAFSSLVPAQVVDLVRAGLRPSNALRAIVVGGGEMLEELYAEARALGWPVLPSYGMTECCSQIATATHDGPELLLLDHFEARSEANGRLAFSGPSLLTGFATSNSTFVDPKVGEWFVSDDVGDVDGRVLRIEGRAGEVIKIGGELVNLRRLDRILEEITCDAAIVAMPDERLGFVIHLAIAGEPGSIREQFDARVAPFERIREVHRVEAIPRSTLGKLLRKKLLERIA